MKIFYFIVFILLLAILTPVVAYFCVKFGTVGFYNAKKFIDKEKIRAKERNQNE